MKEVWVKINNYPNYSISNFGNVKNNLTNKELKLMRQKSGHVRIFLYNETGRNRFLVHRLVALHFIPNPDKYDIVNHLNSNPSDNFIGNLEWTTSSGNAIHARDAGRLNPPVGIKNGMAILNDNEVLKIISLWNKGLTQKEICDIIGVSRSCVAHVTQGRRWKQYSSLIERKR